MEKNTDRRKFYRLRSLFDEALKRVDPCLRTQPPQGLPLEWMVYRTARSAYPQLSTLELFQFAMAASRSHQPPGRAMA